MKTYYYLIVDGDNEQVSGPFTKTQLSERISADFSAYGNQSKIEILAVIGKVKHANYKVEAVVAPPLPEYL